MKKLFLTSSARSVVHDIPNYVDLSKGNKLVFIDTAAEPNKHEDMTWLKDDRKSFVSAGFDVVDYTITGKSRQELEDFLPQFDFIYCSGGTSAHLLDQSYKTGFIEVIKDLILVQEKTYIGTSAGSIIAGPKLLDIFKTDDYSGMFEKKAFGFVDFTIIPHWGSDDFKDVYLGKKLENIYSLDQNPFILLADHQYIHVIDNAVNFISLKKPYEQ